MTIHNPARADRRALLGAAALGSCVGLAIGGAYLVGGAARSAPKPVQPIETAQAGPSAPALRGSLSVNLPKARGVPAVAPFDLHHVAQPARELDCLSQAVYYESRGEPERGQAAVAQVVLNRVRHPRYPKSICGVVFQHTSDGCQFSFACNGATGRARESGAWREARRIAQRALDGFVMHEVGAATDFRGGGGGAGGLMRVAAIGGHVFYRFTGRLGEPTMLKGAVESSAPPRPVLASFAPPSAEQMLAAGSRVMERAAAAISGHPAPAQATAPAASAPATPKAEPAAAKAEAPAAPATTPAP